MAEQKQVVHFEAKKGFTTAQSNEHLRNWTEKGWESANANGRIDRSRQHLNFEIARGGRVQPIDRSRSILMLLAARLAQLGIKDPNEGLAEPRYRTTADFIISGSHDLLHGLAFGDQEVRFDFAEANEGVADVEHKGVNSAIERKPEIEQWARDMYDVLCGKFGEDNVISFVVHCDERTPHIHAEVVPIIDGKLSYKQVFCGADKYEFRQRTLALHDAFAEVNRKWGLERGDSVAETHRRHRTSEEYRRELSGQCSTLEAEVEYKTATLKELYGQIRLAETRFKGLQTMVRNLEASRDAVIEEIDQVHSLLESSEGDPVTRQTLSRKEQNLQRKLESILSKLEDKKAKLEDADMKLADLQELLARSQSLHKNLQKEIDSVKGDGVRAAGGKIATEALLGVLNDFKRVFTSLPPEQQELFDGTFLQDMSQRGVNVIACASLLAVGMIDGATDYAERCGGGGTTCDNNWRRDPDEDEHHWHRRCLAQSRRMMRSSGRGMKR